jgi:hypothetical protein
LFVGVKLMETVDSEWLPSHSPLDQGSWSELEVRMNWSRWATGWVGVLVGSVLASVGCAQSLDEVGVQEQPLGVCSTVSLTASLSSPQVEPTAVEFDASVVGCTQPIFRFELQRQKPSGAWKRWDVKKGSSSSYEVKGGVGTYRVLVQTKEKRASDWQATATLEFEWTCPDGLTQEGTVCVPPDECSLSCESGQTCCVNADVDTCVDTFTDVANCGGCGNVCTGGAYCNSGQCTCVDSMDQYCNGECVSESDPNNCASCGNVCPLGERACSPTTPPPEGPCRPCETFGLSECDGECVDISGDNLHCGACGNACAGGESCVEGECISGNCSLSCAPGNVCCNDSGVEQCVDPQTDVANCGACGNACPGGVCEDAACRCGFREFFCDGECINPVTDPDNCGDCGNVCPPGLRMCLGTYRPGGEWRCDPCWAFGQIECDNYCRDPDTDEQHCGACGVACGAGEVCLNGACTAE